MFCFSAMNFVFIRRFKRVMEIEIFKMEQKRMLKIYVIRILSSRSFDFGQSRTQKENEDKVRTTSNELRYSGEREMREAYPTVFVENHTIHNM